MLGCAVLAGRERVRSEPRTLTVEEVAERLQLRPETIRRWIRNGRIKAVSLGSRKAGYRVSIEEVERIERGE